MQMRCEVTPHSKPRSSADGRAYLDNSLLAMLANYVFLLTDNIGHGLGLPYRAVHSMRANS
jgi:hypothetical protein